MLSENRFLMLLQKLQSEIARHDTPANRVDYQRFFKEKLEHPIGLKTAILVAIKS